MRRYSLTIQAISILAVLQIMGLACWNLVPRLAPLLLDKAGASPTVISWIVGTLPQMFVLLLTPVVSLFSDHHHSAWGRRRPFLWGSTPFFCLALLGIHFASENVLLLSSALVLFSLCALVPTTLAFYIIPEVIPRDKVGRFTAWNGALSSLCAALFNYWGLDWSAGHPLTAFLVTIGLYVLAMGSLVLIPKEESPEAAITTPSPRPSFGIWRSGWECLREALGTPAYLLFFLSMGLNQASMILRTLFGILFATKDLGMTIGDFGRISGLCAGVGAVTALLLGRHVDRHSPVVCYLQGSFAIAAVSLAGFLLVHSSASYRIVAILTTICYSIQSVAYMPLLVAFFPKDKFGQYSGFNSTICSLMVMAGAAIGGWLTDYMGFRFMFLWDFILTGAGMLILLKAHRILTVADFPDKSPDVAKQN